MDREQEKLRAGLRRHHKQRMRWKAFRYMRYTWIWYEPGMIMRRMTQDAADKECWSRAKRYADNLHMCSCPMCGNPRRHFRRRTFQELRQKLLVIEQIQEAELSFQEARSLGRLIRHNGFGR